MTPRPNNPPGTSSPDDGYLAFLRTQVPNDAAAIARAARKRATSRDLALAAQADPDAYRAEIHRLFERAFALVARLREHACPYGSCPAVGTILRINAAGDSETIIDHALLHDALDRAEAHVAENRL